MNTIDLSGLWECTIPGQQGVIRLPGTLDEGGFGAPDDPARQWKAEEVKRIGYWKEGDPIVTRLTRKHTFDGEARMTRRLNWAVPAGKRVFLECERGRQLHLLVNGQEAPERTPGCLTAPQVFEVTGKVSGEDEFTLLSDNRYCGWPRDAIVYASAASDETQTNWNGVLGFLRLRMENKNFLSDVRVYPQGETAEIRAELSLGEDWEGTIRVTSPALAEGTVLHIGKLAAGEREIRLRARLNPGAERWDLWDDECPAAGKLHPLTVSAEGMDDRTVSFGIRDFSAKDGHLTLNGRRIFLRGETNCAAWPETGYCPMETEKWRDILKRYQAYGVNCIRFHSHCPPEAAFIAADETGMMMQPELSHWDPEHAFEGEESRNYYRTEALQTLRLLANHPSFVMMTLGNELHCNEDGLRFMEELLGEMREEDPTRLYANGSNPFYGERGPDPHSDFYTSSNLRRQMMIRATSANFAGWLNQEEAGTCRDYSREMKEMRRETDQPVFSFEVGQYEVLPDFTQIEKYRGVTSPENLRHMQKKVRETGLEDKWKSWVEATGENALQCYQAEVEAAIRTEAFSGISLLSLQDFPGQGTALVGMMDAHLDPKPYDFARPERFYAFFRDVLPLALLSRFVYRTPEEITIPVRIANYGRKDLEGAVAWSLTGENIRREGNSGEIQVPAGSLSEKTEIRFSFPPLENAAKLTLRLDYCGARNEYPLWVYPEAETVCPEGVYECRKPDRKAREILASGGKVYLAPDSTAEALPRSVPAQFSPDFWSVCTFPQQAGCMGQYIDAEHPIFRDFPTERFSTWQWQNIAGCRAMILPRRMKTIIEEMDSCAFLRPMAKLFECRCGGGRLLISSMGLHALPQTPNVTALRQAIYRYLDSEAFQPEEELSFEDVENVFKEG